MFSERIIYITKTVSEIVIRCDLLRQEMDVIDRELITMTLISIIY
jgi:hypothetical protein